MKAVAVLLERLPERFRPYVMPAIAFLLAIFAFWRATARMGYPTGALYRLLLFTGLRLNEAAQLSWPEVHGDTMVIRRPPRVRAVGAPRCR